jgi:hypothetical protein
MKYFVQNLQGDTWQVLSNEIGTEDIVFYQGSLADCEAWIRLKESDRLK